MFLKVGLMINSKTGHLSAFYRIECFSNELIAITAINLIVHASLYFLPSTHFIIVKYNLFHLADSMSVWNLLREFRIRQVHMAVVLNEYGGTIGVCPYGTDRLHFMLFTN
jgi:hypothetical protein